VAKPGAAVERNQVNLIILNEANRQDAETLLARFQGSLDSPSSSPTSSDHLIPLGASGDFILSPFTLVVMTGNSPRDDLGRIEQSRPFQRRISLVHLPNPLANAIATETVDQFRNRVLNLWNRAASESLLASNPKVFQAHLSVCASSNQCSFRRTLIRSSQEIVDHRCKSNCINSTKLRGRRIVALVRKSYLRAVLACAHKRAHMPPD
jgi:hypothetical protein